MSATHRSAPAAAASAEKSRASLAVLPSSRIRRLGWFVGLWLASITVTLAIAAMLRWLFRQMLA